MAQPHDEPAIVIPRWWQPALIAVCALLLADTARYLRRDDWISPNAEGIEGLAAGIAVYALVIGLPAFLGYMLAVRLRPSASALTLFSAAGAAAGVIAVTGVAMPAGGMRMPLYAAVAGCAAALVFVWAVLSNKTARPGVLTAAMAGALAAGAVALTAFQHPFFFDDTRVINALVAAALYACLTLAAVLLAGRGCATGRATAVALVLIATALVPAAIEGLAQVGEPDPAVLGADERPNLLLIVSSALRADYCSVYGGPVPTPWLERLAARGTAFERAYSLAPWTIPSMVGMFSSTFPPSFEPDDTIDDASRWLAHYAVPTPQRTLAERLRHEGYDTAAFVGHPLLTGQTGVLRGFAVTRAGSDAWPHTRTRGGAFARTPLLHDAVSRIAPALAPMRAIDSTGILTGYARAWLERRDDGQPFFLFVHYLDPHAPYTPPPPYRLSVIGWPYDADPPLTDHHGQPLDAEQLAEAANYAGEIRYVDASAGTLLEGSTAAAGNTFIVFTSDHGEEFWDHGGVSHGVTLFEEQIRVPMIILGPGIAEQRIAGHVSHIDLMPTLAGLLEIEPEAAWWGDDRAAWLRGNDAPAYRSPVFVQSTRFEGGHGPLQAIVDGSFKRIRSKRTGTGWLFDLESDPAERNNLADALPDIAESMDARLDAWERLFPSSFREVAEHVLEDGR